MIRIFQFLSLFLLTLVTGVFWGTWFPLTRSIDRFSVAEFIHIGKVIIANVGGPMRVIMPSCIAALILSIWFSEDKKGAGFYFAIVSLVLLLITLLITLMVLVPIDNGINQWTSATAPPNWEEIRERWSAYHTARTFTSLGAFACFSLSVILYKRERFN